MTTEGPNSNKVVIPDTDEARSLAARFARFLALGAARAAGATVSEALEMAVEPIPAGHSTTDRSVLPHIQENVGSADGALEAAGEVGVVCEQKLSDAPDDGEPVDATEQALNPVCSHQEGDQLCIPY